MIRTRHVIFAVTSIAVTVIRLQADDAPADLVRLMRVPEGGIQPQVAVAPGGPVHLLWYGGKPGGGDLFWARSSDGESFSKAIRVNSQARSRTAPTAWARRCSTRD